MVVRRLWSSALLVSFCSAASTNGPAADAAYQRQVLLQPDDLAGLAAVCSQSACTSAGNCFGAGPCSHCKTSADCIGACEKCKEAGICRACFESNALASGTTPAA